MSASESVESGIRCSIVLFIQSPVIVVLLLHKSEEHGDQILVIILIRDKQASFPTEAGQNARPIPTESRDILFENIEAGCIFKILL